MRTYSRDAFLAAKEAWRDYGPEWASIRQLAAERGFIYPPTGTIHDDRDAESPSQRAIVWRALRDNPNGLRTIIGRSRSWDGVIAGIFALEDRLRTDAHYADKDAAYDRDERPTHREAVQSLGAILGRIEASR